MTNKENGVRQFQSGTQEMEREAVEECMRWEDDIKMTAGPRWKRVTQDRPQWKSLEEAYAKRHTEIRDIL